MKYHFTYSKQATKFLRKSSGALSQEEVETKLISGIKKILKEEITNADIKLLEAEWSGYFRLRIRDIRIIFTFEKGEVRIVEVEKIEFRGSVY
jgi:mRNA-degrading endonuclease RelE of RelBE toxin-antitoxin system